jgi:hypothetical protein
MPVKPERLQIAKRRIKNILRTRLYANIRQLESKIAEAGPSDQRCDPHVISQALRELAMKKEITSEIGPHQARFYYLPSLADTPELAARKKRVLELSAIHHSLTSADSTICGDALESVIGTAISETGNFTELGSKKQPLLTFGDVVLPGSLDYLLMANAPASIVALEAKNIREWIYPDSHELWLLIHKAMLIAQSAHTDVVPLLICRKIPYYARMAFKQLGVLGFEMHKQYYIPAVESQLTDIRHKDGLGFHDITTDLTPPETLIRFLETTLPEQTAAYAAQFRQNIPVYQNHAELMGAKKFVGDRKLYWLQIKQELELYLADYED